MEKKKFAPRRQPRRYESSDGPRQERRSGRDRHPSEDRVISDHPNKNSTIWSYYHNGDVKIPEICVYSIDNRCSFEDRGCLRLHAKCTSQWQLRHQGNWCNLRNFHSKEIEDAFEDVTRDSVQLSAVNPVKLGNAGQDMFKLLGNDQWEADFESMRLQMKNSQGISHKIRRLSTQSYAVSKSSKATTYEWYFLDIKNNWIKYGENDSINDGNHISSITSEEIERNYINDKSLPLNFHASKFQYILDLESMQQTNTETKVVRPVRRRPVKKASTKTRQDSSSNRLNLAKANQDPLIHDFPTFWDAMKLTDPIIIIALESSNQEYKDISSMLLLTLPSKRAVSIKRVQNPFLWRPFQNKKDELILAYGSQKKLNIQRLFHGTRAEHVDAICKENFDWRLHGTNVGDVYGRGSYFSNSAAFASRYCVANGSGNCFMLVAEVIVGEITKGNASMTRPPKNESTSQLYDTTVDDVSAPKIFVKYDKQEYCPLYIIEYK